LPVIKRFPVTIQSDSLDYYRKTLNYQNDEGYRPTGVAGVRYRDGCAFCGVLDTAFSYDDQNHLRPAVSAARRVPGGWRQLDPPRTKLRKAILLPYLNVRDGGRGVRHW
jgi:hypothetical protein